MSWIFKVGRITSHQQALVYFHSLSKSLDSTEQRCPSPLLCCSSSERWRTQNAPGVYVCCEHTNTKYITYTQSEVWITDYPLFLRRLNPHMHVPLWLWLHFRPPETTQQTCNPLLSTSVCLCSPPVFLSSAGFVSLAASVRTQRAHRSAVSDTVRCRRGNRVIESALMRIMQPIMQ